jgi:hypothetical protein
MLTELVLFEPPTSSAPAALMPLLRPLFAAGQLRSIADAGT